MNYRTQKKLGKDEIEVFINQDLNPSARYELEQFLISFKKKYDLCIWEHIQQDSGTTYLKMIQHT